MDRRQFMGRTLAAAGSAMAAGEKARSAGSAEGIERGGDGVEFSQTPGAISAQTNRLAV